MVYGQAPWKPRWGVRREWMRWNITSTKPVLGHTSFRGQLFDGVWKERMETLDEGVCVFEIWIGAALCLCRTSYELSSQNESCLIFVSVWIEFWYFLPKCSQQSGTPQYHTLMKIGHFNYSQGFFMINTLHVSQWFRNKTIWYEHIVAAVINGTWGLTANRV